jgi:DNA-binding transcriptional regulator GbsR (MarR family)
MRADFPRQYRDRMSRVVRDRFVAEMGTALHEAGLARLPSRVFSALLVDADGRMTSAELAAGLGVSPAGVSGAVKYLTTLRLIRRERLPGSRRDVYVVDDDAWHETMMNNDVIYAPMVAALDRAIADVDPDAPERHRLDLTREFLVFVTEEMAGLAQRWERRRRTLLRGQG